MSCIKFSSPPTCVKFKLLFDFPSAPVPDNGSFVHRTREQQVALLIPLEGENGPLVICQRMPQLACTQPIPSIISRTTHHNCVTQYTAFSFCQEDLHG